jgi:hypothetical protein
VRTQRTIDGPVGERVGDERELDAGVGLADELAELVGAGLGTEFRLYLPVGKRKPEA